MYYGEGRAGAPSFAWLGVPLVMDTFLPDQLSIAALPVLADTPVHARGE